MSVFDFFSPPLRGGDFLTQKLFLTGGDKIEIWQDQRNTIKKSPINLFFLLSKA